MARAHLLLSQELEQAFATAQNGKIRYVKIQIDNEQFALAGLGAATLDVDADCQQMVAQSLDKDHATFLLFCLDVNVPALRWILLAFVPEHVSVRDKMLYSSSRESLKKQLGMNYFVGEFHATEIKDATLAAFLDAKKKQTADAPLSETERLLKETALLERDTNVKSTAMGVIPFTITQNVREKLVLFQNGKFDWIAMKLNTESESVEVAKSLEHVDVAQISTAIDTKNPSFVAYRCLASASRVLVFLYICPEDAPVRQKMVYSTCKATILSLTSDLGIEFEKTIEINNPATIVEDVQSELTPSTSEDDALKVREFARPSAPGRGRGRGRGRGPPPPSTI